MTVAKGLKSIAENTPNFSNQALENAIAELKLGWIIKSSELDTAIESNTVLTTSQKNDLKDNINNVAHLNIGRVFGDLIRHTNTVLDGSIVPVDPADNPVSHTFLEILQNVQTIQGLVPEILGVPASDKNRAVNDHLGSLNNVFLETTDSSAPVFTSLKDSITFITNASLATETALETAIDNLKTFINGVTDDSTDFQQTLNTFATAVATAQTNFNNALASEPYLTHRTKLVDAREAINVQVALENSNLTGILAYVDTLSSNLSYAALAEDSEMRRLMANVAQDINWRTYFNDYETNQANLNPIYATSSDSDKSAVIDQVLADSGLPDVTDSTDFDAVASKAKRDSRIDTANFDRFTAGQIIEKSCVQLGITTANRTTSALSGTLLRNMNQHDRDIIASQLDLNESADTIS